MLPYFITVPRNNFFFLIYLFCGKISSSKNLNKKYPQEVKPLILNNNTNCANKYLQTCYSCSDLNQRINWIKFHLRIFCLRSVFCVCCLSFRIEIEIGLNEHEKREKFNLISVNWHIKKKWLITPPPKCRQKMTVFLIISVTGECLSVLPANGLTRTATCQSNMFFNSVWDEVYSSFPLCALSQTVTELFCSSLIVISWSVFRRVNVDYLHTHCHINQTVKKVTFISDL